MGRIIPFSCVFLIIFYIQTGSETKPVKSWSEKLDSSCFYTAVKGDTIITITDRITLLSLSGEIISRTQPLDDLKDLSDGQHYFGYLSDNTILIIKNKYLVTKLGLSGEELWSKSLRDTIPNAMCNDFTEDRSGIIYFCGDSSNQSAFIIALSSQNGEIMFCSQESVFGNFHSIFLFDQRIYLASSEPSAYLPSAIVTFDTNGNFISKIADDSTGTVLALRDEHIYTLGSKDGVSLFKTKFFATRDILIKKYDLNGFLSDSIVFDFGKYETPVDLVEQSDGLVMVTISDETVNMGSNILNYFITKLDNDLQQKWQIQFGTDSSGLNGNEHKRTFFANETGIILSSHNDTLMYYSVPTSGKYLFTEPVSAFRTKKMRIYDLKGCLIPYSAKSIHSVDNASGIFVQESKCSFNTGKTTISVRK